MAPAASAVEVMASSRRESFRFRMTWIPDSIGSLSAHSITSSARASRVGLPPLALSGALLVRRDHGDASMHRVHDLAPRLSIKPIGELVQPLVQSAPKLNAGGNRWRRFDRA